MTMLQAFGNWLEEAEVGTLGVDLFLGERPASPAVLVAVTQVGGEDADVYLPVLHPIFRCVVRAATSEEALESAEALRDRLHQRENFALAPGWWCYLALVLRPAQLCGRSTPEGELPAVLAEVEVRMSVRSDQSVLG